MSKFIYFRCSSEKQDNERQLFAIKEYLSKIMKRELEALEGVILIVTLFIAVIALVVALVLIF